MLVQSERTKPPPSQRLVVAVPKEGKPPNSAPKRVGKEGRSFDSGSERVAVSTDVRI